MSIGTPPQSISLSLDTGSSAIIVNTYTSAFCSRPTLPCIVGNAYNPEKSTSKERIHDFWTEFSDGTEISGVNYHDVFYVAAQHLDSVRFGVADTVDAKEDYFFERGIFGIGFPRDGAPEDSVLDVFVRQNLIKIKGYSLWQETEHSGRILFGGIVKQNI